MGTVRLTMAQALVRYLCAQRTNVDGADVALFAGVFAIFGHGNVAGLGEAPDVAKKRELGKKLRRAQRLRRRMAVESERTAKADAKAAAAKAAAAPADDAPAEKAAE